MDTRSLHRWLVIPLALGVSACGMDESQAYRAASRAIEAADDGDLEGAESYLAPARKGRPDTAMVQEAEGRIALARLRPDLAVEPLKKAVHLQDHPRRRGLLGRALMGIGKLDDAADELENALSQESDDAEVLRDAVYVYARTGRISESLELASRLKAIDPGGLSTKVRLASAYLRSGKVEEARTMVRTLNGTLLTKIEDHVLLGGVLFELQDGKGAVAAFERALSHIPQNSRLHYNLGTARILTGDFRTSKKDFERALELDPKDAQAKGQLAYCLSRIGRKETARKVISEALADAPGDPVLRLLARELGVR